MNKSFMEKSLINRCSQILGISSCELARIFEMDKETSSFIKRRISYGINSVDDNIGFLLKGLLSREFNDFSLIKTSEIMLIKNRFGIEIKSIGGNKPKITSEKVDPLILGVVGETLLRDFAKVLCISRKDAIKVIKCNVLVKDFLQKEKKLTVLDRKSCLSVMLQNTLKRHKNDFSKMTEREKLIIYKEHNIIVNSDKMLNKRKVMNG